MRLIDADELIEHVWRDRLDSRELIANLVESMPTIEPQRIKKGSWIQISPGGIYECSICGLYVMTPNIYAYDYCHGCGNPMEVIKNGNE